MDFLAAFGTLAVIYLLYILSRLSERLGSVEKMPPFYRYYYVAALLGLIGLITQVVEARALTPATVPEWLTSAGFILLMHHLPLAIGATIGLIVSWRYWSWLITHQEK